MRHLNCLNVLWDPNFLMQHPEIFCSRLLPLNKTHPNLPDKSQMRPIVVTSALFKVLELRFVDELRDAFDKLPPLSKGQVGFISGMSTHVNISRLCEQISQPYLRTVKNYIPANNGPNGINQFLRSFIIFIDYEQAYNSVNMGKLYNCMATSSTVSRESLDFIFWTYSNLNISLGNHSFNPKFGVPQGGINSPLLFDFAIYFMLEDFVKELNDTPIEMNYPDSKINTDNHYLFADDAAFALHFRHRKFEVVKERLKNFILILHKVSKEWGLHINFKKSAIMPMFNSKVQVDKLSDKPILSCPDSDDKLITFCYPKYTFQIPVVVSYKYLGIYINKDLSLTDHLRFLKKKTTFLSNSFIAIRKASQMPKFCYNTWEPFIRPNLDYSSSYAYFVNPADQQKLQTLYRTSLKRRLFLKDNVPDIFTYKLIQFSYRKPSMQILSHCKCKVRPTQGNTERLQLAS